MFESQDPSGNGGTGEGLQGEKVGCGRRALAREGWGSSVEWPLGVLYTSKLYLGHLLSTGSPGPVAADSPGPERLHSETPTYVNIPISPTSRLQLHYMDLELSGASGGVRGGSYQGPHRLAVTLALDLSPRCLSPG